MDFILVMAGGACGSLCRYLISLIPFRTSFPILTLLTNFVGAVVIGFIAARCSSRKINLVFKTGFCGGFTTFSTFSLESFNLLRKGQYFYAGLYMMLSVSLCIAGVAAGYMAGLKFKGE